MRFPIVWMADERDKHPFLTVRRVCRWIINAECTQVYTRERERERVRMKEREREKKSVSNFWNRSIVRETRGRHEKGGGHYKVPNLQRPWKHRFVCPFLVPPILTGYTLLRDVQPRRENACELKSIEQVSYLKSVDQRSMWGSVYIYILCANDPLI